jgi:hypothetical protein
MQDGAEEGSVDRTRLGGLRARLCRTVTVDERSVESSEWDGRGGGEQGRAGVDAEGVGRAY